MRHYGTIYVAFDGDNDIEAYNKVKSFRTQENIPFDLIDGYEFYSQIDKVDDDVLKEQVLNKVKQAKIVVVLMGKTTKSMRKYIRWQVEGAINMGKPVIVVNENNIRAVDFDRCPALIKKALTLHISFNELIFECAVSYWPKMHSEFTEKGKKGMFKFPQSVYSYYGLDVPALDN